MKRVRYVTDQENHSVYIQCTHCDHEKYIKVASNPKSVRFDFNSPKNRASSDQGSPVVTPFKSKILRNDPKPKNTMAITTPGPITNERSNINRGESPKVNPSQPRTKMAAGILKPFEARHSNINMRKLAALNHTKNQSVTVWCAKCKKDVSIASTCPLIAHHPNLFSFSVFVGRVEGHA